MASSFRHSFYQANTPTPATAVATLQPIGSSGSPDALSIITHPNGALLPPVVYLHNPKRRLNFDLIPLVHARTSVVRALEGSQAVRFDEELADVVVTEIWPGSATSASMIAAQWRAFKQYFDNPPATTDVPAFVRWQPRDQTTTNYLVEIIDLTVGGEADYDVLDIRAHGGTSDGGDTLNATDGLNTQPTGVIDREVRLVLLVKSEVDPL